MTFGWHGHLKYGHAWSLWKAILVSWLIALLEYCLTVPANRYGFGTFTGFQLKSIQEVITVSVFIVSAITFLKKKMAWNYAVSFAPLIAAVVVAFAFAFAFNPARVSADVAARATPIAERFVKDY
jgi:uncharacterized protein (DUF486 family)